MTRTQQPAEIESYCMDNFHVDVTARFKPPLEAVLSVISGENRTVTGTLVSTNELTFFWCESSKATLLPYTMRTADLADFILGWLKVADYGPEPDHDGDNSKDGWRVFRKEGLGWEQAFTVAPAWAMHGK